MTNKSATLRPDQNYGLSLLKILMSFEVVLCHFWGSTNFMLLKPFSILRPTAVMTFMFTAFLLTGNAIMNINIPKIKIRLLRLISMNVLWTLIYAVFFKAEAFLFGVGQFAGKGVQQLFKSVIFQLLMGSPLNPPMWFQFDLVSITIIFFVVFFVFQYDVAFNACIVLGLTALFFQYSGINFMLFGNLRYELKYSLGRLCEMIPVAVLGIIFAKYNIMHKLSQHCGKTIVFCTIALIIMKYLGLINASPKDNFMYSGLSLLVCGILITTVFYVLPLKEYLFGHIKLIISKIARFTPGCYCIHIMVGDSFNLLFNRVNNFVSCVGIYIICLAISYALSIIFPKLSKYLVE